MLEPSLEKLRELLGDEFSEEEIRKILQTHPGLNQDLPALLLAFKSAVGQSEVPLGGDFNRRVMAKLQSLPVPATRSLKSIWSFFTMPRLAIASGLAASLLLGLWWVGRRGGDLAPGLNIQTAQGPGGETLYCVRFALKDEQAKQVSLSGDFNAWNGQELKSGKDGVFSAELELKPGSYAYSFLVDGKLWVVDPSADKIVEDGFGNRNSVVNL